MTAFAQAEGGGQWWQMPQGGLDKDEDPYQAALRELYEETSIRSVSLIREAPGWLTYDLPPELVGISWKGRYRGQKQKWFALRFEGDESEIDVLDPGDGDTPEFSEWRWETLDRLPELSSRSSARSMRASLPLSPIYRLSEKRRPALPTLIRNHAA